MGKGLSLQELREAMETDATKRNLVQAQSIKGLQVTIKKLEQRERDNVLTIAQLCQRCQIYMGGILCIFCGTRVACRESQATIDNGLASKASADLRADTGLSHLMLGEDED